MNTDSPPQSAGFTRLELLGALAALGLLGLVTLPALAGARPRSDRVICANNLRQIAAALQEWGNDHDDRQPWDIPTAEGGSLLHPLAANVWLHCSMLSNHLASPKVLLCPSDTGQPARDFSGNPDGGYLHPNFANRATSYFLSHPRLRRANEMLAGDRNVTADGTLSCSQFIAAFYANFYPYPLGMKWTSALHNNAGNIVALDGRVEQFSTSQFQRSMPIFNDQSSLHYITPR